MQVTIFRGSKEVGGNCIEVISGSTRLILDVGMPLFDGNREPIDGYAVGRMSMTELDERGMIPKVKGLFRDEDSPDAILLSHAHLDHVGLLRHTRETIPIYASRGTSKMMLAGAVYANQNELPRCRQRTIEAGQAIQIGEIAVTAFSVDHSIHGCLAFLLNANGKRLLYTGDLRLHGRQNSHQQLIKAVRELQIDALIVEGTHFGFENGTEITESELEAEISDQVAKHSGLVLAAFSPQNADRLMTFIHAASKNDRVFVADAYTAFVMHLICGDAGLSNPLTQSNGRVLFPKVLRGKIERRGTNRAHEVFREKEIKMAEILCDPKRYLMVFRPSMMVDFDSDFPTNTLCLFSTWQGYSDRTDWKQVKQAVSARGGSTLHVHTSGHAHSSDLVEFAKQINARTVIPIHSFEPEKFREHLENVTLAKDGEAISL